MRNYVKLTVATLLVSMASAVGLALCDWSQFGDNCQSHACKPDQCHAGEYLTTTYSCQHQGTLCCECEE